VVATVGVMRVALFCGSTSESSANRAALDVAADSLRDRGHEVAESGSVVDIPIFRPEQVDDAPPAVAELRSLFESAEAVVLAVPEYGGGAAGWAKNALDWMVGSGSLYRRVCAVLCAGTTGGPNALEQIARTLTWQGAFVVGTLGIAAPRTKSDHTGRITDASTIDAIAGLVVAVERSVAVDTDTLTTSAADTVRRLGIDPIDRTTRVAW
jgi:chromate reductase